MQLAEIVSTFILSFVSRNVSQIRCSILRLLNEPANLRTFGAKLYDDSSSECDSFIILILRYHPQFLDSIVIYFKLKMWVFSITRSKPNIGQILFHIKDGKILANLFKSCKYLLTDSTNLEDQQSKQLFLRNRIQRCNA